MAEWAKYSVLIDWNGSGLFDLWDRTGANAMQYATSGSSSVIVVVDGTHTGMPVGTKGELFDFWGNRLSDQIHTVTAVSAPAFGFRNITVSPSLPANPVNGDTLWAVVSTGVDVSPDQLAGPGISWSYGRDSARSTGGSKPGEASFSLDNSAKRYSPENPSSLLAGDILQARPLAIRATYQGTVYTLYQGHTDDFRPTFGRTSSVDVTAVDGLATLSGLKVSTELHRGIRTGDAINALLDAAGWAGGRDIDPGATQLPYFWLDGDDALDTVRRLIDGEGLPSFAGCDANGNFVFRDRHHRMIRNASRTVQSTWRDAGADPRFSLPLTYEHGARDVINAVEWEVGIRMALPLGRIWEQTSPLTIADGATVKVVAKASEPFYGLRTPTTGYDPDDDYQTGPDIDIKSGSVNVAVDRSSGQSVTISLTAVGGSATIDSMTLRAYSCPVAYTVKISDESGSSVAKYGRRMPDGMDPRWASVHDVASIGQVLLGYRAQRLPVISVTFSSGTPDILREQLQRDLSDRVRVIYGEADLDREFIVERAKHIVTGRRTDRIHRTTFELEAAPEPPDGTIFVLGSSNLGGTDVLAAEGFVDPDSVMILGTTNLGEGVLAP